MTNEQKSVLLTRIELLEREIAEIKQKLMQEERPGQIRLRGMWKGLDVTDEDFEEAKRSLFPDLDDF